MGYTLSSLCAEMTVPEAGKLMRVSTLGMKSVPPKFASKEGEYGPKHMAAVPKKPKNNDERNENSFHRCSFCIAVLNTRPKLSPSPPKLTASNR